jgi:hypothetical protein
VTRRRFYPIFWHACQPKEAATLTLKEKHPELYIKRPGKTPKISLLRHVLALPLAFGGITSASTTMSNQGDCPGGGGDAATGAASSATSNLSSEPAVGEKRKAPPGMGPETVITTAAEASSFSSTNRRKWKKRPWTDEEDTNLMEVVLAARSEREDSSRGSNPEVTDEEDDDDWDEISQTVPDRTAVQCLQRYLQLEKKRKGSVCVRPIDVCSGCSG